MTVSEWRRRNADDPELFEFGLLRAKATAYESRNLTTRARAARSGSSVRQIDRRAHMILFACVIQLIAVIAAHSSVHTVMPKIRTTRTKKPPEGYEEIEAVCENYLSLCVTQNVRRFLMTTQRKCGTPKTKPTKANGEPNHYGLSCVSRILVLDTSTNSITNEKLSPRSSMIGYSRRATLTQSELFQSPIQTFIYATGSSLIAKWKKTGYEKLCCIRCIQTRVSAFFIDQMTTLIQALI